MLLRDSQRAAGGGIVAVTDTWNGLGKVGAKSHACSMILVMPNGSSARYQGKAYVSTCGEWMCFLCIKLGGTAEVLELLS